MNKSTEELLESEGWRVDCYSPLELTYLGDDFNDEDLGTATGDAARFIIDCLIQEHQAKSPLAENDPYVDRLVPRLTYKQWLVGQILAGAVHKDGGPDSLAIRAIAIADSAITYLKDEEEHEDQHH